MVIWEIIKKPLKNRCMHSVGSKRDEVTDSYKITISRPSSVWQPTGSAMLPVICLRLLHTLIWQKSAL